MIDVDVYHIYEYTISANGGDTRRLLYETFCLEEARRALIHLKKTRIRELELCEGDIKELKHYGIELM